MTAPKNVPVGVEAPPVASVDRDPDVPPVVGQEKAAAGGARPHTFRPDAGPYCRRCQLPRGNWRYR